MLDPIWKRYLSEALCAKSLSDYQLLLGASLLRMERLENRI